jgi:hypothetical protein
LPVAAAAGCDDAAADDYDCLFTIMLNLTINRTTGYFYGFCAHKRRNRFIKCRGPLRLKK